MDKKIGIIGSGGWGIALSIIFNKLKYKIYLWEPLKENYEILIKKRENINYFKGVKIPKEVGISNSLEEVVENSKILIIVVRSSFFRKTIEDLKNIYKDQYVIIGTKGLEYQTSKRMSEILTEYIKTENFAILSGPTIAKEIVKGYPTAAVIASKNLSVAESLQKIISCENFRIYTSTDIIGAEIGGSFKNIVAIGAGIIDGLKLGINTKSSYITRGLNEMIKIGTFLGGEEKTFRGLSGIGDLITTSFSKYSRNRSFGEGIVKIGKEKYLKKAKMVIEGIPTTKAFYELSRKFKIELPITEAIYRIIYENSDVKEEIKKLMIRELKRE
ncbi:MAG: NAD(P)-dependent glycerol-3-phosphate dehydrogenase [Candidatus Omnitrophica bacterium]|nr:NAD(P)-dependent glycerol-3-phosphate dehydrogenase [Candidatus Omnitrophota bacterium]MCM8802893.1 NAD(P)-dependent glycerol-3-phosphate dehydrogenase [Candidatus Omnitrophota bacterium]